MKINEKALRATVRAARITRHLHMPTSKPAIVTGLT
jgi:hypothetical protein